MSTERWFMCKGCGQPAAVFPDGKPPLLPRGAVAHAKPAHLVNVPNSVPCKLYNMLSPQEFAAMHEKVPSIEPPEEMYPVYS